MLANESAVIPAPAIGGEISLKKLLVAFDFSAGAEDALQYAVSLACVHGSVVAIAYVESPADLQVELEGGLSAVRQARVQVQRDLQVVAQSVREQGIACTATCRVGAATDVLVELASATHTDLLLLTACGHRHVDARRLGSTAEFLLRSLPCPTMTFGPYASRAGDATVPHHYLLYASSIPNRLGRAARYAESFARRWGATVEILHVIDEQAVRYDSRHNAEMDVKGTALAQQLRDMGINAEWHLRIGSPADKIVERGKELDAGIIIFGIEHQTSDSSIYGLVSATVQRAACPVLTVPGPA